MTIQVERWGYFEWAMQAQSSGNPFLDVELTAAFTLGHRTIRVRGFYDGDDTFKVRFMPDTEGTWQFVTHSNLPALNGQTGVFVCTPANADNHGPVRVVDKFHFAYEDGTPHVSVGTTCYVWNLQGDELEEQTLATLKTAPFNKMRMCVFPKRYAYNQNEPPSYPFEGTIKQKRDEAFRFDLRAAPPEDYWNFDCFNPAYFQRLDKRILNLRDMGIEADIIIFHPYDFGAWGFDKMPAEVNDRYLKYLVARVAAFRNVWWSFANEYDLMLELNLNDWDHRIKLVQAEDPYDHLRSIHNCFDFYDHRKPWITHCSVQHHDLLKVTTWLEEYGKPVVVDECGYEGDIGHAWGSLSAEAMVECFWLGFAVGGYVGHGETYLNDEEILWWSKGGHLTGESPARIAFLRQIMEAVPKPGLFPLMSKPGLLSMTQGEEIRKIMPEGIYKGMAGGRNRNDYFLLYMGRQQPRFRQFNLPEGDYRIDIIDTWNMTIDTFAEHASGQVRVELPRKKYLAVRIEKNR